MRKVRWNDGLARRAISLEQNLHFEGWSAIAASNKEMLGFAEWLDVDGNTHKFCFDGGKQSTADTLSLRQRMHNQLA